MREILRSTVLLVLCLVIIGLCSIPCTAISTKVHTFYYLWYGNIATDGKWMHWDERNTPPNSIGAAFYPLLGIYSSNNSATIHQHMKWLRDAGVGVVVTSWWGQGSSTNSSTGQLLDIADLYGIKVIFHMEPYGTRTVEAVIRDLKYVIDTYGSKPAFYRDPSMGNRPWFYYWVSTLNTDDSVWAAAWDSIRGTAYDSVVIGDTYEPDRILAAHWDGFYNYFQSNTSSWKTLADWAKNNNKIFIPTVSPGWDSSHVNPNGPPIILRNRGQYYDSTWSTAAAAGKSNEYVRVAITSFNEWHEGTQIEPAIPQTSPSRTYPDYLPDTPTMYIDKTASWAAVFDASTSGKIQCEDYSGGISAQEGVDYHDTTPGNNSGKYRKQDVDIQDCAEGGYNIGWIAAGEWMRYTNVQVNKSGMQDIRIRGASLNAPARVRICDSNLNNTILTLTIPVTGGFQHWQTVSGTASMAAGSHTIYLYSEGSDCSLNWFEIRPAISSPNSSCSFRTPQ